MIGTRIGPWLITEEIGDGGHAFVFKGVCDGDVAAIKMLKPSVANEENLERRFKIEVEALKSLSHPGIVGFKDYFYCNGYHYLVLEYMDAGAIDHMLRVNGPIEPRYALPVFYKVLDGMTYAHSFGYIHRDIKPNNILLNKRGEAKVTDFGIAKVVGGENLTQQGFVLGTTLYMAPEYLSQGQVTPQTDIYALGVLLYEMLTNRKPFEFKTEDEPLMTFAKRVCMGAPVPPTTYRPIPAALERIVMKAIARDTKKRYRTVERFQADLKKAFPELIERPIVIPEGRPMTQALMRPEMGEPAPAPRVVTGRSKGGWLDPWKVLALAVTAGALVGVASGVGFGLGAGAGGVLALMSAAVVLAVAFLLERRRPAPAPAVVQEGPVAPAQQGEEEDPMPFHDASRASSYFKESHLSELEAFLEVTSGRSRGKRYGLRPISRIGRDLRFDIRPHDPEISRHHAVVSFTGSGFVVTDTGSTNGTFVNEDRLAPQAERLLHHGDILRVGRTTMRFEHEMASSPAAS